MASRRTEMPRLLMSGDVPGGPAGDVFDETGSGRLELDGVAVRFGALPRNVGVADDELAGEQRVRHFGPPVQGGARSLLFSESGRGSVTTRPHSPTQPT